MTAQVKKYDWDIDPEDANHPTIHGLRGTGILARAEQGYEVDQIANDIGMFAPERRTLHALQGPDEGCHGRPEAAPHCGQGGLDREPSAGYISRGKSPNLQNSWPRLQNFRKKRCNISAFGGEWCNGSTTDSDSVCLGSNPGSPATLGDPSKHLIRIGFS